MLARALTSRCDRIGISLADRIDAAHGEAVLDGELAGPGGVDLLPSFQARIIVTASTVELCAFAGSIDEVPDEPVRVA